MDAKAIGNRLVRIRAKSRVDSQRPDIDELRGRIGAFWLGDRIVLYVGKAASSARRRVGQYYRTPLGARSPHAGGWFLSSPASQC